MTSLYVQVDALYQKATHIIYIPSWRFWISWKKEVGKDAEKTVTTWENSFFFKLLQSFCIQCKYAVSKHFQMYLLNWRPRLAPVRYMGWTILAVEHGYLEQKNVQNFVSAIIVTSNILHTTLLNASILGSEVFFSKVDVNIFKTLNSFLPSWLL